MVTDRRDSVLIVEDDAYIADLEQRQLERAGFSVLIAGTAEKALDCLRRHSIQLVLLDYRLPGDVDGLEFHVQMKEAGFDLPVILVTGFSTEALAIRALRAGVSDFLTKSPEYLDYLPEAVGRVLKQVHTEHQLAETKAHLTSIIDSADDAIIIADGRHRISLFNRAAEAMFRCPASQAVGQPASRFIAREYHAVSDGETGNPYQPVGDLTHLVHYGNRGVRADGTEFPLEASLSRASVEGQKFYTLIVRDITRRKRAEEALAAERNLLRTLIDAVPDFVFTKDSAGRFAVCNPAVLHRAGFTREEEMAGKTVFDLYPREMADIYHADDLQVLGGQPVLNHEEPFVDTEGNKRWHLTIKVPLRDHTGAITGLVGISRDITEKKNAEAELRASEERFRQLAENIREVFWLTDPVNNKILYVSPAYEAIWGRTSEALYRSPGEWLDAIHPDDRERMRQASLTKETAGRYDEVYRIVRPDGSIRWIHDQGFPVRNEAGEVYRVAGVGEDITERRRAEIASQQQQQRLEGIVNSAMDGIITIDEDQRVILINSAAERMFGWRAEHVVGQSLDRFIPERFRAGHAEHVRGFGRTGVASRTMGRSGPISGLRADGEEFPIEASISQIPVEGRKLFTVTCRDVTERVRAAEMRQKLEAQLLQSQKMEAFGQLAGGIAHDFNNLLTIISGYSEILLTMLPVNDPMRGSVKAIGEAGSRAASLTRQLLAFSRQTVLEPKVLDLNEVVRETEKLLRRLIGEDILLTTLLDPSIRHVKVDPGLLGQVLMNLAVNSRDAMPQGGKLSIETGNVELDARFPHATRDFRPGMYVLLAVSDTGCGMTPEVKARIFEPFFTTKGVGKGTGLGLAVVHGIVSQSGGLIAVESEPGQGTTFKIYFLAVEGRLSTWAGLQLSKDLRGNETILLVEDEENVRGLATLVLQSYGYRVLVAQDGKDALRVAKTHRGNVNLLLTDVVMPHLSGRELAAALQPLFPRMKVLYMSGYTDDAVVRHGLVQEQVPFLQKPATPLLLASKVRSVLDATS